MSDEQEGVACRLSAKHVSGKLRVGSWLSEPAPHFFIPTKTGVNDGPQESRINS